MTENLFEAQDDLTKKSGPKYSILALGYTGWGPGQLEYEIKQIPEMPTQKTSRVGGFGSTGVN